MKDFSEITAKTARAFWRGRKYKKNNTVVDVDEEGRIYLYVNNRLLARRDKHFLEIDDCGWRTLTVRERLNGILHSVRLKLYSDSKEWYIKREPKEEAEVWGGRLTLDLRTSPTSS